MRIQNTWSLFLAMLSIVVATTDFIDFDDKMIVIPDGMIITRTVNGVNYTKEDEQFYYSDTDRLTDIYVDYSGPVAAFHRTETEDNYDLVERAFLALNTAGVCHIMPTSGKGVGSVNQKSTSSALSRRRYTDSDFVSNLLLKNGMFLSCYMTSKPKMSCIINECEINGASCLVNRFTRRCMQRGDWRPSGCQYCRCLSATSEELIM
ncbi:hypothetical protein Kpol_1031p2 [Vanderwaltozyma polyspora DSM 70294]|uniref:Uncharacterized protein n=1 Tax=Vanderwaltozyma polyspora (strain ATCC 22028 / DSM 70294 / BCRC 21397 / CBS 2163 / NBRC 10782 / NRRL Y-8283 / UCD 57-17) TaxID=436907 RepID=A7THT7_VANPO|nr:uncharacterized protein Kpol_1031p2 [Vanderwaltozyma polyspora DSM 70294]EDO18099.1 hypothetical protein Kpol_1031p2 [Vanderwaltozyma polyspora DSM 70294]